jgi:hypothetical protein
MIAVNVELALQSRSFFLPGFLQDFGVYANHAQVESNIHVEFRNGVAVRTG